MLPVETPSTTSARTEKLAEDVEGLLNPVEADGSFHDSAECLVLLIGGAGFLLSPPAPRPTKR
ncbi:hypothetical protein [Streptomyces sp. MST-110588]|uniref:hypothetical protein n=1 Tax=Streptomyces sp. MST-110588 TaxID=2833628 RepID=UPI001F5C43E9|nr:hypothetical protein [Streptomyces sp. MST-110588]